ncbi:MULTISPECIES: NAD(P)H-dependent oxidoreductase [Paenibacillus]|uniref:NAD(P)H-dependent oxidoreductase n=1 Tax=Paenibacillus ottowii TaxID=2315729 RepID=A0ABY3AYT7_9BACL|nr:MULTISPECIES: NAD(P)H-dependent oxidoreductase [Paenibacillus]KZE67052.1 general stress protein [Paenibacillus jamilae]OBA04437.1 general stress protein [Paenibacillus polymyxa]TQR95545.1 NAD(P)H-dependent oxidoreductase [Paenibacillus ottowii]
MSTLVIVVHPDLAESRINKRWMQELEKQSNVTVHNLYEVYPDEQINVAHEQKLLEEHDRIVLQFPFYWYSSPSLLKKWLDKVLTYGWAYGSEGGKLQGKELLIALSAASVEENYQHGGRNRYTIEELLRPFEATGHMIGVKLLPYFVQYGAAVLTDEQLEQSAQKYVQAVIS